LEKPLTCDGAAQAVELGQAHGAWRCQPGVGVVLDDHEVVRRGQLQHLVGLGRAQAVAGGVVQHRDRHVEPRPVLGGQCRHHGQVGAAAGRARHRQHAHAQARQPGELHRPAGLVDQHGVAGCEQASADDVERLRRTGGGDDLRWRRRQAQIGQPARERGAQRGVAGRIAVAQPGLGVLQPTAQGALQQRGVEPGRWQRAHARCRTAVLGLQHAADERRGVHRRRGWQGAASGTPYRAAGGPSGGRLHAHEEAPLRPGLDQAAGLQQVVGADHRARAHAVARRAVAHRGQPGAGREQPLLDALGEAGRQLFGQPAAGPGRGRDAAWRGPV
jgi:hypothetical protein